MKGSLGLTQPNTSLRYSHLCNAADFKVRDGIIDRVLANNPNRINHMAFSICFVLIFQFFFQLLCISLLLLIFPYSAQILLKNALFCRQNARLKSRFFWLKLCRQNLSKPTSYQQMGDRPHDRSESFMCEISFSAFLPFFFNGI